MWTILFLEAIFADKKCEDKESWCETAMPDCNRDEIKEGCQKYCGLCKGMNQPSKWWRHNHLLQLRLLHYSSVQIKIRNALHLYIFVFVARAAHLPIFMHFLQKQDRQTTPTAWRKHVYVVINVLGGLRIIMNMTKCQYRLALKSLEDKKSIKFKVMKVHLTL